MTMVLSWVLLLLWVFSSDSSCIVFVSRSEMEWAAATSCLPEQVHTHITILLWLLVFVVMTMTAVTTECEMIAWLFVILTQVINFVLNLSAGCV